MKSSAPNPLASNGSADGSHAVVSEFAPDAANKWHCSAKNDPRVGEKMFPRAGLLSECFIASSAGLLGLGLGLGGGLFGAESQQAQVQVLSLSRRLRIQFAGRPVWKEACPACEICLPFNRAQVALVLGGLAQVDIAAVPLVRFSSVCLRRT